MLSSLKSQKSIVPNQKSTKKWCDYFMRKFIKFGYIHRSINLITKIFYSIKTLKYRLFFKRRYIRVFISKRRYRKIITKLRLWSLVNPLTLLKNIITILKIFIISKYKRKGKVIVHIPWPIPLLQQYKLGLRWLGNLFRKQHYPNVRYITKSSRIKQLRFEWHKRNWQNKESTSNLVYRELRDILLNRKTRIIKRIRLFINLLLTKHINNAIKHR